MVWSDLRVVRVAYADLITLSAKANFDIPFFVARKIFESHKMLDDAIKTLEDTLGKYNILARETQKQTPPLPSGQG